MIDHESIVNTAAHQLSRDLEALYIDSMNISAYYGNYLRRIIQHKEFYCSIYKLHILHVLRQTDKPIHGLCFLDYGAGCGLLAVLARRCGFGTVICNDIYEVATQDAAIIGEHLHSKADHYVTGDISILHSKDLHPDIICGMDVIEHIYDLDEFFKSCLRLSGGSKLAMCFGTGSNPYNPIVSRRLKTVMNRLEYEGSGGTDKERDSKGSYTSIRKNIILKLKPELNGDDLEKAVIRTRGMNRHDIESAIVNNEWPQFQLRIKENTCDPVTGNWAERMLFEDEYFRYSRKYGFNLEWHNGYYDIWNKGTARKSLLKTMNSFIRHNSFAGRRIAPYAYLVFKTV